MLCENQKKPLVSVLLRRLCLQVCVSVTVRGRVPGCEPRSGVYSNDIVTHARSCVCVCVCVCARQGESPAPAPTSPYFYSSLLSGRAWLRRPHHLHPLLKKQPRPLQSHQHPPPPSFSLAPRPLWVLGSGGAAARRGCSRSSCELMTLCPEPGQAPGRRGPQRKALCINRWRGSLCLDGSLATRLRAPRLSG